MRNYFAGKLSVGRAMGLMSGVSVVSKLLALSVQWVLGLRLMPEDFALYGSILAVQGLVAILKDSGVGKYLIRENTYDKLAYVASVFSVLTGAIAAGVLVVLLPFLESGMHQPNLFWLMLPVLLGFPVQSFTNVFSAKLRLDGAYLRIALIDVCSSLLRSVIIISLVFAGAGVYALVAGGAFQVIFSYGSYRLAVGSGFVVHPWSKSDLIGVFSACKWIMLGGAAAALVLRAEYFVMGFSASKEVVGQYFFALQLVMSLTILLTSSFQTVLMPVLAKCTKDVFALQKAYDHAQKHIANYSAVGTIFVFFSAPHVMHILWGGRWDQAGQVVQILVLAIGLKLHVAVSGVLLEACGQWKVRIVTLLVEALFVGAASSLIFFDTNLAWLAVCIGLARVFVGVGQLYVTQYYTTVRQGILYRVLPLFLFYAIIGYGGKMGVGGVLEADYDGVDQLMVLVYLFILGGAALVAAKFRLFFRGIY